MDLSGLTAPLATALGALLSLTGVLVGGGLTVWHQRRLEREKIENARADAIAKELSSAVQQLTIHVASAVHSMCWLTWLAARRPDQVTQERIDKYDAEQHITLPKILGYLTTTAALDAQFYDKLREQADEVFRLDAEIGEAGLAFVTNPSGTATALAAYYEPMLLLERRLPVTLGNVVGARLSAPLHNREQSTRLTSVAAG